MNIEIPDEYMIKVMQAAKKIEPLLIYVKENPKAVESISSAFSASVRSRIGKVQFAKAFLVLEKKLRTGEPLTAKEIGKLYTGLSYLAWELTASSHMGKEAVNSVRKTAQAAKDEKSERSSS